MALDISMLTTSRKQAIKDINDGKVAIVNGIRGKFSYEGATKVNVEWLAYHGYIEEAEPRAIGWCRIPYWLTEKGKEALALIEGRS